MSIKNIDFSSLILRNNLAMSSCLIDFKKVPDISFSADKAVRGWEDWLCWLNCSYETKNN